MNYLFYFMDYVYIMKKGTIVEVIRNDGTADIHFVFYCDQYIDVTSIDQLTLSMLKP